MVVNLFKVKKWAAFLLVAFGSVIGFYLGLIYFGLLWAIATMLVTSLVFILLGSLMISTPFRDMLEGKGILTLNWDSTGVLRLGIVGLHSPYIRGKMGKEKIEDVWDRATVAQIEAPKKSIGKAYKIMRGEKAGGLRIDMNEQEYNDSRFALFHWPVLIWNDQIKSLITKEWLSNNEKETFAEHGILYLNRKMEELTGWMRDFARHVVESTKPKGSIFENKWFWILGLILIGLLIMLFVPGLMNSFGKVWESTEGISQAAGPINPR